MVEKKRVVKTSTGETARKGEIPSEKRCTHKDEDGRQCRQRRWAGKEVCWQHDETRLGEQKQKEASPRGPGFTPAQLQELLAMALSEVFFGRMPVGRAYALGYLAQQMLTAHAAREKEMKLDVKHFWEMVELGATFERAVELAKERKKKAKQEREEKLTAEDAENAEDEEEAPDPHSSCGLRRARAGEEEENFTTEDAENAEDEEDTEDPPSPPNTSGLRRRREEDPGDFEPGGGVA
jgi:hypothetical protein